LQLRGRRRLTEPQLVRGARRPRHEDRLRFDGRESREARAPSLEEPESTRGSTVRHHRHARSGKLLDIPVDRAHGDLGLLGQALRAHPAVGLEEHEDLEEPPGSHAHTLQEIHDTPWHIWDRTMEAHHKETAMDPILPVSL